MRSPTQPARQGQVGLPVLRQDVGCFVLRAWVAGVAARSAGAPVGAARCDDGRVKCADISDEEFAARFASAREMCFTGHGDGCTYGGLTPAGGYWLAADGCTLDHGDMCTVCGGEPEARFGDWASEDGALLIWGVWLCAVCRDRELALNAEKWRWQSA